MAMKYVSAHLMAVLGGNDSPSAKDIKKILEAGGLECDSAIADKLVSELNGKAVHEVIADGREKLQGLGGGGGGGAAAPAAGGAAPAAAAKQEEVVEEEEEEMEFDLFD